MPKIGSIPIFQRKDARLYGIATIGFILTTVLFWPGMMSPDSLNQFGQAQSGIFSNHNPPLMTLLWFGLNKIIPGSGLLFLVHSFLLWLSLVIFTKSFEPKKWWSFCLIPLWPTVFAYTQLLWKDVSFSYSFLLVIALLTWHSVKDVKPPWTTIAMIGALLLYGIGTKYQAVYCVPVLVFWLVSLANKGQAGGRRLGMSLLITGALYLTYQKWESWIVPVGQQSHAWQMARLYDLAGISVRIDYPLFPPYILHSPPFSFKEVKRLYSPQNVDSLVYTNPPLLKTTQHPQELKELWNLWKGAVLGHPVAYLQHRARVWLKLINKKPDNYFVCLEDYSKPLWLEKYVVPAARIYISLFPSLLTRFYWVIVVALWGLWHYRGLDAAEKKKYSLLLYGPLICFTQLFIYFFLSMASDLRYLYLSNCIGLLLAVVLFTKKP